MGRSNRGWLAHLRQQWAVRLFGGIGALLALMAPGGVFAWGHMGHQVVAVVAEQQLTPSARAGMQAVLAEEPGATLASISTWADEPANRGTGRWHYVNLPRGDCRYLEARDCPGGECVVRAIIDQTRRLQAADASAPERLQALKYLVHLVADIHQPLHAGHADDRGGNLVPLAVRMAATNLHALWDWGLLALESEDPAYWVARLNANPASRLAPDTGVASESLALGVQSERRASEWSGAAISGDVDPGAAFWAQVAQDGCLIVAEPGFTPPPMRVDDVYLSRYTPVAAQQLAIAARRLAALLNALRW